MSMNGKHIPTETLFNMRLVCLFLVAATLAVYGQVGNYSFLNYDDDQYVTENPHVRSGLNSRSILWAFTATHSANWHPLTWLSHMLDCQLYGMNAGGHHLTNVLFHIANTLLLFLILLRMTGDVWRSGLVSALFALHPLHVESVAWVAERKDVLSTFFWMLTMWAYVRYTEQPGRIRYVLVLLFFGLGLMAKPMLVTLPFVLLLMDYWPLGRWSLGRSLQERDIAIRLSSLGRLLWEKIPLFALVIVSSVVTFLVQQKGETVGALDAFPLRMRIANALVSYVRYIGKMLWPCRLAVFYPYPGAIPIWWTVGSGLLLLGLTLMFLRKARRLPYLAVGWLWYVGTLVPVIGLVQVGSQAMADRYTYVPLIGLFILVVWGIPDLVVRWRNRRLVLGVLTDIVLLCCIVCTWLQVGHWDDSVALYRHTLRVTDNNYLVHNNLGNILSGQGRLGEAVGHYFAALCSNPNYVAAYYNLGVVWTAQGRSQKAISYYSEALRLKPDYADAHNNLGVALADQGKYQEAIGHYSEALRIRPDYIIAHNNLGIALVHQGKYQEAIGHYSEALRLKPDYAEAHNNLGVVLAGQGRLPEAIGHYSEALRLKPDYITAYNNLGVALADQGKYQEAISYYSEALRLKPDYAEAHNNLGVVLAGQGRLPEAIGHYSEALRLKPDYAEAHNNLGEALAAQGKIN